MGGMLVRGCWGKWNAQAWESGEHENNETGGVNHHKTEECGNGLYRAREAYIP